MTPAPGLIPIPNAGAGIYRTIKANQPFLVQAWLPALLFAIFFFLASTASFGSDHTSRPLHTLMHLLFGSSGLAQSIDRNWSHWHHILRKTGHFVAYGVFSLVCFRGLCITLRTRVSQSPLRDHALAVAAVFLVAGADELHQSFVPNRTGCFSDVLLDTAGAFAAQLALWLVLFVIRTHQHLRAERRNGAPFLDRSGLRNAA